MNNKPDLWVLAGGNGAGKSTFYQLFLKPKGIPFINADVIAREIAPNATDSASYNAAILAAHQREGALTRQQSFCYETVFSHDSKLDFLAMAMAAGYTINLVIIYLDNPGINRARVAQRVSEGGHHVPENKIDERIPRTHHNLSIAVGLCDNVMVFDNSSNDNPYRKILTLIDGKYAAHTQTMPEWVAGLFPHHP